MEFSDIVWPQVDTVEHKMPTYTVIPVYFQKNIWYVCFLPYLFT